MPHSPNYPRCNRCCIKICHKNKGQRERCNWLSSTLTGTHQPFTLAHKTCCKGLRIQIFTRLYIRIFCPKKHSHVHKAVVSCWFPTISSVKGWDFKPSHRFGWRTCCEWLKIQVFTLSMYENQKKRAFRWRCECFFGGMKYVYIEIRFRWLLNQDGEW